jgi:hypothetical protein
LAAIAIATLLLAVTGIALNDEIGVVEMARWVISDIVYGLTAAGFYAQRGTLAARTSPEP